jgi:hypothetical protein
VIIASAISVTILLTKGFRVAVVFYDDIQISRLRLPTKSPKFRSFI